MKERRGLCHGDVLTIPYVLLPRLSTGGRASFVSIFITPSSELFYTNATF